MCADVSVPWVLQLNMPFPKGGHTEEDRVLIFGAQAPRISFIAYTSQPKQEAGSGFERARGIPQDISCYLSP